MSSISKSEVIISKKYRVMLVPHNLAAGINTNGYRFKIVDYKKKIYVMLDWTMETCRLLAATGIQIESPMRLDYEWAGQYDPYKHQLHTAEFMCLNPRSFIFNDIGTGKTLSALWAADYLMQRGEVQRALICSTVSTLNRVWENEIFTHFLHRKSEILTGTKKRRLKKLAEPADFYIINHDGLKVITEELMNRSDINLVIADEGAVFRNKQTGLWTALNTIAGQFTRRKLWWMTGSPMPKAPTDAWGQALIVNPKTVPQYFSRFRDQTMHKVTEFKWVPRKGWEDICYSVLVPSIRYDRDDCLDLPDCTYVDHSVPMSADQATAYKSLLEEYVAEFKEGLVTAANEGAKIVKLLQVACGAIYNNTNVSYIDCSPKLDELDQILTEVGTKLIIFVPFKHSCDLLVDWLRTKKKGYTYGVIHGDVSSKRRDEHFRMFQDEDLDIIIAHPATMAHGLTLTAANTICWFGPVDNFEIYEQANGRITRPGQTRKQYIKHLTCSPIEQMVYKRLKTKENMQGILLDMIKN